ncbi:MAG TPA: toxin-antitoxin system HicB family antitoxin [Mucilaginibacter sp.]|jgi:predicted HicB family RNase H-like nuclease|nr:toxin-antitoxin system HicB family antitoxin [Mucilaginibacter sp.]
MNDLLKYKDYLATINYSAEDEVFYGRIFGINDLVTFEGTSVSGLKKAFQEAVNDYIATCRELDKTPEKSYKGVFNVRVPANLHKKAALAATKNSITLNEFVKAAIAYAVDHEKDIDQTLHLA